VVLFTTPGEAAAYVEAYGAGVLEGDVWSLSEVTREEVEALRLARLQRRDPETRARTHAARVEA
jgi:hypothetical protein